MAPTSLGDTLKIHRKARGLSLSSLAAVAGVHKSTLSRWESGKSVPFTQELSLVLEALGLRGKERQECWQYIEAPRSVQMSVADANAAKLPISSGELLRALRLRAGITQSEAARVAGVSQSLILKWEKGDCWPSDSHLHLLCFLYKTTQEEMIFLTTRAWRQIDPLPLDKDALDAVIRHLENHDSTPHRSPVYLALASRYQALFRAGKISEADANSVYGCYGYYLAWRLGRHKEGRFIAAPAMASLGRSRGPLSRGQREAILLEVEYSRDTNACGKWELVKSAAERDRGRSQPTYQSLFATILEQDDNIEGAIHHCRQSIAAAQHPGAVAQRSNRLITLLCRQGRFRQALPLLAPTPSSESRVVMHAENHLNHARVFDGLGEHQDAQRYYARAETLIQRHGLTDLMPSANRIVHSLTAGKHA